MRFKARCPHCGRDTFFQEIEPISLPNLNTGKLLTGRRIEVLEKALGDAIGRCEDMLMQDDAQAYKETERMLPDLRNILNNT